MLCRVLLFALCATIASCAQPRSRLGPEQQPTPDPPAVHALVETMPVASPGDAADDPAIWVHPTDPSKSVVIGTNKQRGLDVYDVAGRLLQSLPDGRMNNVDLRDGFKIGGRSMALVAATNRTDQSIALYLLDPDTGRLESAGKPVRTGFADPYGLCMYLDASGRYFVFASDAGSGRFRQWRLRVESGAVVADPVREFVVGSQAEGCAADDETGALYVAEEDLGLWRYLAGPDGGNKRRVIDKVGGISGLAADLEGVSIWQGSAGHGYVVVSNQGANSYALYRREGNNEFVGLFRVADEAGGGIDGTSATDGLAVTSQSLGPQFPEGMLVVQDGENLPAGENQNFKFVSWQEVMRVVRPARSFR